jgi:hypothetical protein
VLYLPKDGNNEERHVIKDDFISGFQSCSNQQRIFPLTLFLKSCFDFEFSWMPLNEKIRI